MALLGPHGTDAGAGCLLSFAGVISLYCSAILSHIWHDPKTLTGAAIALNAKWPTNKCPLRTHTEEFYKIGSFPQPQRAGTNLTRKEFHG